MPVVRCPGCNRQLNVPDTAQRVQCPQCNQIFATTSDGITAAAPAASLAAASAVTTAPARSSRPGRDEQATERGSETLVVVVLSVVAALILFAVVGGAATWFLFAEGGEDFMVIDHAPPVHEVMIDELAPDPLPVEIDPQIELEKPVNPAK